MNQLGYSNTCIAILVIVLHLCYTCPSMPISGCIALEYIFLICHLRLLIYENVLVQSGGRKIFSHQYLFIYSLNLLENLSCIEKDLL